MEPAAMDEQTVFVRPLREIGGTSRKVTLVKTAQVEVTQLIIAVGHDIPTHVAQGELIIHCLEGRVSLVALGKTYDLAAGHLVDLLIDEPFSIRGIDNASVLLTLIAAKTGGKVELIGG